MLRIAGRIPTTVIESSVCSKYGAFQVSLSRLYAEKASTKVPPPSQIYDANAPAASSSSNPSSGNGSHKGSGKGRKAAVVLGATAIGLVAGGGFLVLDPLGLFLEKKPLAPAPSLQAVQNSGNVIDSNRKSVSSLKHPIALLTEHKEEASSKEASSKADSSSASAVKTVSATSSVLDESRISVITSIAEDSVQFMLSGKRTPDDRAALAKLEQAVQLSETNKLNAKLKQENELRESQAAEDLARQNKREAEQQSLQKYEDDKERKNKELEQILFREFNWLLEYTQKSVTLNRRAADVCNEHSMQLKKAMAADVENVAQEYWPKVCDLRKSSLEQSSEAQAFTEATEKRLVAILDIIDKAKKDKMTSEHLSLSSFETQAKQIASELHQSAALLHNAGSVSKVMKDFFETLQSQETAFQQELEDNLPKFKLGQKGNRLSEEELNALLVHAHQRVLQLKRQLREQELLQQHRIQEVLSERRETDGLEHKARLQQELDKQQMKCRIDKEAQLNSDAEREEKIMEEELARTSLALNNHAIDMLKLQERQLTEEYTKAIEERIEYERSCQVESLASRLQRIDQLTAHIAGKLDADELLSNLRRLVLSSQNLMYIIAKQDPPTSTGYHTVTVGDAVDCCKESSPDDEFVQTILRSISEKALSSGLYTISSLERRFENVVNECKKSAFLPNSTYLLSSWLSRVYASMMLFSVKPKFTNVSDFYKAGTHGMDTKDLLVQAQYFVDRHCLTEAVRCMVQLKGVPCTLAQDWIDEARLYLEVLQASEALHSYAMAQAMGQIL